GSLALLVGAGDSCKGWLALSLAVATGAGRPVFAGEDDSQNVPSGAVLYITAENGIAEEQRRCRLLKAGLDLGDELPLHFVPAEGLCLSDPEHYEAVRRLVVDIHPVAIFVDSTIAVSGIREENDNTAVRAFMSQMLVFARKYGATLYLIHHSPKLPTTPGARF